MTFFQIKKTCRNNDSILPKKKQAGRKPACFKTGTVADLTYSILALTTEAICIISMVCPSFSLVKSTTLPLAVFTLVLLMILINLA
jgi:hypothetical protein